MNIGVFLVYKRIALVYIRVFLLMYIRVFLVYKRIALVYIGVFLLMYIGVFLVDKRVVLILSCNREAVQPILFSFCLGGGGYIS